LRRDPVVAFLPDRFTRPNPLRADVVIDVGPQVESILDMLACHESQMFEWLPYNQGLLTEIPADASGRRNWLRGWYTRHVRPQADRYREALVAQYGQQRGQGVQYCEVFEISEYASPLDAAARDRLFGRAIVGV
jgi:hypothetical protein